jgi:hypothetical protein
MLHVEQLERLRAMTPEQRLELYRDLMQASDLWLRSLDPEEVRRRFRLQQAHER